MKVATEKAGKMEVAIAKEEVMEVAMAKAYVMEVAMGRAEAMDVAMERAEVMEVAMEQQEVTRTTECTVGRGGRGEVRAALCWRAARTMADTKRPGREVSVGGRPLLRA